MTDKKISELTSITGANVSDANDVLPIVDTSVATTKKITRAELFKSVSSVDINGGTIDGTVIGGSTPAAGTFTSADLAAIAETKAVTAVDVFVYDTSKDSDGGAWRKRTQHTSWYNETLNTATRGARREFPAVAVIVAEASKITIYDGDDPSLPMWMVFNEGVGNALWSNTNVDPTSVVMLNGIMCVCQNGSGAGGFNRMFFIEDTTSLMIETTVKYNVMPIAQRNRGSGITVNGSFSAGLVNRNINDVAITVLPDAPIDPATGLPVPTIAVATEGGVSVIKDDGTVVSGGELNSGWNVTGLFFDGDATLWATEGTSYSGLQRMSVPPFSSVADIGDPINGGYGYPYYNPVTANTFGAPQNAPKLRQGGVLYGKAMSVFENMLVAGNNAGISKVLHNSASQLTSLVNYTTSTYNTGWMNGDIKGAFLADTDDTDLVGGTDADRSVNNNPLTVNGTVTRSEVSSGAELVAYSGFSSSNYLEQPYNSALDFGTGDFCVMGWFKEAANSAVETILERDSATTAQRFTLAVNASGFLTFTCDDDTTARTATSTIAIDNGTWTHFVATYDGAGGLRIYLNGALNDTETGAALLTLNNAAAVLRVGLAVDDAEPLTNGNLALLRISATAPTAEAIKKIYEDEKFLFQENAACTLYGASDAVTALAHDPVTNILSVGTSAGRSDFQGLRRVKNTTTAVGVAISAAGGMIVEE